MTRPECNLDSVQHSFLSTSNISRRCPAHELTSVWFGFEGIMESQGWSCAIRTWRDIGVECTTCCEIASTFQLWLQYLSKLKLHRDWLTYAGSREEGMPYRIQIAQLDLCDSDIPPNPNCVRVNSCGAYLLLMLEVRRRECSTEFESHRCRVVCLVPSTYAGSREKGMSYQIQIAWLNFHDPDIPRNLNCVDVNSCALHPLLMLGVKKRNCHTESESLGCWVVCGWPYTSRACEHWTLLPFFCCFFLHFLFSKGIHTTVFTKATVTRDLFNVQTSTGACWNDDELQNKGVSSELQ